MADSEEDCDTWRNRDKYPKEREASEKKASLSPVDQKSEKRPFNTYQSPSKSVEPPFKKQKSNFGEDSGYNNSGSFNNRREGFENRRDNFENRKDSFDNRKDNFDNRKDNFDNRKDNFDNRKDNFDSRKDSFDNRKDSFDNRKDSFDNRKDSFDNRKDSFDNRKDSFDNRKDNFDNRKNNFDNRKGNFDSRPDNFNNRRDNFDNKEDSRKENFNRNDNFDSRNEGFDNKREAFDRFPNTASVRPNEESPNYPTQPPMLLFKHFLQQQDDNIEMEAAMVKYNEYKENFIKKQLKAFFDAHNSQEWFREKYLPLFLEVNKLKESKNITSRKEIFSYLLEHQWMDTIKLHVDESDSIVRLMDAIVIMLEGGNENDLKILDSRRYRSESPNDIFEKAPVSNLKKADESKSLPEVTNEEEKESTVDESKVTENVEEVEMKDIDEPRALHKTFSIFLRNLHPNVLRSEIEALVKPYDGFLRLALQDPTPDRKFFRRGWVTYDRTVNIKEICWNLNNIRLHDCDIGAIVNRELTQRVRSAPVLTNHKPVMRHDIKLAAKLVAKFDKRHNLWPLEAGVVCGNPMGSGNPLLKNITEYLVDEGSYEEEALLGGNLNCNLELTSSNSDPSNITIENDDSLARVLDKLVLYLRFVHSYDYYSNTEYQSEDEMPHRCGIMHARGAAVASDRPLALKDVEDYIKSVETKADVVLSAGDKLTVEEAKKLGYKDIEEVTEAFILANTQELAKDKWLCPLSGKKFKGPDFVRKHILNKHMDKVDEATLAAHFFNNYLLDVKRPQLPEHPTNRPGAKIDVDLSFSSNIGESKQGDYNRGNDGFSRGMGRRNEDFDRRGGFRGLSPNNRDFAGRNNFDSRGGGNNGSYYRKNNFSVRGGPQGGRSRNGGGSYYSRNMTSYKDLDAPMDD